MHEEYNGKSTDVTRVRTDSGPYHGLHGSQSSPSLLSHLPPLFPEGGDEDLGMVPKVTDNTVGSEGQVKDIRSSSQASVFHHLSTSHSDPHLRGSAMSLSSRSKGSTANLSSLSDARALLYTLRKTGVLYKRGFRWLKKWESRLVTLAGRMLFYFALPVRDM